MRIYFVIFNLIIASNLYANASNASNKAKSDAYGIESIVKKQPLDINAKKSHYLKEGAVKSKLGKKEKRYLDSGDIYKKIPEDSSPYLKPKND